MRWLITQIIEDIKERRQAARSFAAAKALAEQCVRERQEATR